MSTELAVISAVDDNFPVLAPDDDMRELLAEAVGDEPMIRALTRVSIPPGGTTIWSIPSASGEDDHSKTIEGIILGTCTTRSYWEKSLDGGDGDEGSVPPDCASVDGKIGYGAYGHLDLDGTTSDLNPSGNCADCPMGGVNAWGSGKGRGKACREFAELYVLRPGTLLPIIVRLSTMSLKNLKGYKREQAGTHLRRLHEIVTTISLEKHASGGNSYGVVKLECTGVLDDATKDQASEIARNLKVELANRPAPIRFDEDDDE